MVKAKRPQMRFTSRSEKGEGYKNSSVNEPPRIIAIIPTSRYAEKPLGSNVLTSARTGVCRSRRRDSTRSRSSVLEFLNEVILSPLHKSREVDACEDDRDHVEGDERIVNGVEGLVLCGGGPPRHSPHVGWVDVRLVVDVFLHEGNFLS